MSDFYPYHVSMGINMFFFSRRFFFSKQCPTLTVTLFYLETIILTLKVHFIQKLVELLKPSPASGNLVKRAPPLILLTFHRNLQNLARLNGPLFSLFGTVRLCFRVF